MKTYKLTLCLLSETTFGRGDGIAGLIDEEVEHDAWGFPYLRGRTLKGVLSEECDNIVAVLSKNADATSWKKARSNIFGESGSTLQTAASWSFGDAQLPADLREAVATQLKSERERKTPNLTPTQVLESLTSIRRQTAISTETGAADEGSLRSMRVIIRELVFSSDVHAPDDGTGEELMLLAAGCLALRHIGQGRNRGLGHIRCSLHNADNQDQTESLFHAFAARLNV